MAVLNLDYLTYHPPTPEKVVKYNAIQEAAVNFAKAIAENAPDCADQTAAIRKVKEAQMTANAAIANDGAPITVR